MLTATTIWLLVLIHGTANTGYTMQILFRTETQAQCAEQVQRFVERYPELKGLPARMKCVPNAQKTVERYPY